MFLAGSESVQRTTGSARLSGGSIEHAPLASNRPKTGMESMQNDKVSAELTIGPGKSRLAVQVANDLRNRILAGELADGAELPTEDELRQQYAVSRPTIREALRVLEAEALVVIRRGAIGGAVVHQPTGELVTYGLGLVLASRKAHTRDLWVAISELEPACAAACAELPDRMSTIVPTLRFLVGRAEETVGNVQELAPLSRMLHEAVIELCGNTPLTILTASLKSLLTAHETRWAEDGSSIRDMPLADRKKALSFHRQLIEDITEGDGDKARETSGSLLRFLWESGYAGPDEEVIKGAVVRDRFTEMTHGNWLRSGQ